MSPQNMLALLLMGVLLLALIKRPAVWVAIFGAGASYFRLVLGPMGVMSRAELVRSPFLLAGGALFVTIVALRVYQALGAREPMLGRYLAPSIAVILIGLLFTCGMFYTPVPVYGRYKAFAYWIFNAFAFFLVMLFIREQKNVRQVMFWIFAVYVFQVAALLITSMRSYGGLPMRGIRYTVGTYYFADMIQFAAGGSACAITAYLYSFIVKNKIVKTILLLSVVVFLLLPLYGATRSALLGYLIGMGVCVALIYRRNVLRTATVFLCILIVIACIYQHLPRGAKVRFTYAITSKPTDVFASRIQSYQRTLGRILNPRNIQELLIGRGAGSGAQAPSREWLRFVDDGTSRSCPHNVFLEITYECGIIGGGAFAIYVFCIALAARRLFILIPFQRDDPQYIVAVWCVAMFALFFMGIMVGGDVTDVQQAWLFGALILAYERALHHEASKLTLVAPAKTVAEEAVLA